MATDMWTLINRELSKIEKARGGASDTPYLDVVSETMRYAKEDRAWKERKNLQRQQVMGQLAQGTGMIFDEKDLVNKKERFQNYYNKYKGDMDETTLEMGQFMLDDFGMQAEKNKDFAKQENKLESMQTNMVNTLKEFDRMDVSQNEDYANRVKDLNEVWLDYVSDFKKTHGERLSLKPFQHIDSQLDNGAQMNDFLLGSIRDDEYIDDAEHQAWKDSWESLSLEPINVYKKKEAASNAFVLKSASKKLVENIEQYQLLDSFSKGSTTIKIDDMETSWADLDFKQQASYLRQKKQFEKEIKNLDKNYSNKLGKSFVDEMYPDGLFPIVTPTTTPITTPTTTPTTTPVGEKKAKITDEDVSSMQLYMEDSKGYHSKVAKEFRKSKKAKKDMTLKEFLENRPDLKDSLKDASEHKVVFEDAKKFLEKKIDYDKIGKVTYAKENGNKVKYMTYYMSPDEKIISTPDLKLRRKDALSYLGGIGGGSKNKWRDMHDKLANAKLYKIRMVYDPYKRKWTETERKEA